MLATMSLRGELITQESTAIEHFRNESGVLYGPHTAVH